MTMQCSELPILKELLVPHPFTREHYASYLYVPYSRKLRRRVYFYTPNGYDLWVRLESDPTVATFNERVPKIPISLGIEEAIDASPHAISVAIDGAVTVHILEEQDAPIEPKSVDETISTAWKRWSRNRGYGYVGWSPSSLRGNLIELNNLKKLLRFVSFAGAIPDFELERSLIKELQTVRRMTFFSLANQFPTLCPERVQMAIARLIVDKQVFSDIDRNPFNFTTELSAYRGLDEP